MSSEDVQALLDAAKDSVKLPRGKKACKEAAEEVLKDAGGDTAAAIAALEEKFGAKKKRGAPKKAKAEDDGEEKPKPAKKPKAAAAAAETAPEVPQEPLGMFPVPDSKDKEAKKALADTLVALLRQRGVKLPTDDDQARIKVGGAMLQNIADGSVDGDGVLRDMAEMFGTEAADAKRKAKAAVELAVPENEPILEMLREMGRGYFKMAEKFKGASYQKAGTAVKGCAWAITLDALPHEKKGHERKLEGVGKGTIATIKEFLETGKVEQLEEWRALGGL